MTRLILVIPAFNEGTRLNSQAFLAFLNARPDVDLLFVDDGSTDTTQSILRELTTASSRVQFLSLDRNQGKGEAVRQGVLQAFALGPAFIGYWDADLATPLDEADRLCAELNDFEQVQLAIGSRVRLLGRNIQRHAIRHYLGRVFATAVSLLLRLPVYDSQCGAKVFRATDIMRECFRQPFATRWLFDVELLGRMQADADTCDRIREVPLMTWCDIRGSKLTAMTFVTAPLALLRTAMAIRRWPG